ncbi:MAG: HNH endonuclease [Albidovulum sp.]|nr:HNH endonuclease [Albidovulum sp.]MDE0305465.1 HNH endonuclease [Albidovulum sp.]MDE0532447.1 HNH endonuclease [Albidovulum sp.]
MFSEIAAESPCLLALGARKHAMLATAASESVCRCLARDDWTCHICGVRLPEFMEVDHVNGHDASNLENLRTICQFCHNLRHPVWSALRGRLRLIWAPGLEQAKIHRLAWLVFMASGFNGDEHACAMAEQASLRIAGCIDRRESAAVQVLGGSHVEAFFEALFAAKSMLDDDRFARLARTLDAHLRFWPVAADRVTRDGSRPSASVSCWREGGFADVSEELLTRFWTAEVTSESADDLFRSAHPDNL